MVTHTPVTELLRLKLREFHRIYAATARVLEKRRE